MPHFIVECSNDVLNIQSPEKIIQEIYTVAVGSQLFRKEGPGGVKVRLLPYVHYTTVGSSKDFIHVFANIMEGRSIDEKNKLTSTIVSKLTTLFPTIDIISMNIFEFEKATYHNKFTL